MRHFTRLSHSPTECRNALGGAVGPIYIDIETTGLMWADRLVSVGLLVDTTLFILFVGSNDTETRKCSVNISDLRYALEPLVTRTDLTAVFHNAVYDLVVLCRNGIKIHCKIEDTLKLLKLTDPDRGWESDEKSQTGRSVKTQPRIHLQHRQPLNYKLKAVARHILNVKAEDYPGSMANVSYRKHVAYLASDVIVTKLLYQYILGLLALPLRKYSDVLVSSVTPILVAMTVTGCVLDQQFVRDEGRRLKLLMEQISSVHRSEFGQPLTEGDAKLRNWASSRHGLDNLQGDQLRKLWQTAEGGTKRSLGLLLDYRLAKSLRSRLLALLKHVGTDGVLHSSFNDMQSSGRITSNRPNLQQIAGLVGPGKKKEFVSNEFRSTTLSSRNAICARPGHILVAFDVAQADIRCLAHLVENFSTDGAKHIERLGRRFDYRNVFERSGMWDYLQQRNANRQDSTPQFDPTRQCGLARDFRRGKGDFYSVAAERMLGHRPKDKTERNHMKQTILGIVNGMSATGLAERLEVSKVTAEDYLRKFAAAYPQEAAFTELMQHEFAMTGEATTFAGRTRRVTPHWWMVNLEKVELLVSYRGREKLWVRAKPLMAGRHVLTCHVHQVIDAEYSSLRCGKEIYSDSQGPINVAYRFFEDDDLVFRLPIRNIAWRLIRRVRNGWGSAATEEARYEGFDRTRRQLFNHLAQGATADVVKRMMLRCERACRYYRARLLLQIHDELVFEVPEDSSTEFTRVVRRVLQLPPTPSWRVPIVVEPKIGHRFGALRSMDRKQ